MPVGWGQIPIRDILSIILPEYNGMLMMELRSRYFDYIAESRDNLAVIMERLRPKRKVSSPIAMAHQPTV